MISCDRCGRMNGTKARGDSWICEDCRVEPDPAAIVEPKEDDFPPEDKDK